MFSVEDFSFEYPRISCGRLLTKIFRHLHGYGATYSLIGKVMHQTGCHALFG